VVRGPLVTSGTGAATASQVRGKTDVAPGASGSAGAGHVDLCPGRNPPGGENVSGGPGHATAASGRAEPAARQPGVPLVGAGAGPANSLQQGSLDRRAAEPGAEQH